MKQLLFAIAAVVAAAASADEVLKCEGNAQAEFRDAGVVLQPAGYLPGWASVGCSSDRSGRGGDAVPFKMDWRSATGKGKATFAQLPDGKVLAQWFMAVDKPVRVEQFFLGVKIPFDRFDGGTYAYDGKVQPFPKSGSKFQFGYAGGVKMVALVGKDGKTRCEMVLDGPYDVCLQDNSRFGGGFELRIKSPAKELSPGEVYFFGATIPTARMSWWS